MFKIWVVGYNINSKAEKTLRRKAIGSKQISSQLKLIIETNLIGWNWDICKTASYQKTFRLKSKL